MSTKDEITVAVKTTSIGSCIEIGPLFAIDGAPKYAYIYLDNMRPDEMPASILGQQALDIAHKFAGAVEAAAFAQGNPSVNSEEKLLLIQRAFGIEYEANHD